MNGELASRKSLSTTPKKPSFPAVKNWMLKHTPLLVGAMFIWAGVYKLLFPGQATMSLETLNIGYAWAKALVAGTIVAELYLGAILLVRLDLRYCLALAMALMFAFTVYLWYISTLAEPPKCGCLGLTGMFSSAKHEALFGVFRNCAILWALKLSWDFHFPVENKPPSTPALADSFPPSATR